MVDPLAVSPASQTSGPASVLWEAPEDGSAAHAEWAAAVSATVPPPPPEAWSAGDALLCGWRPSAKWPSAGVEGTAVSSSKNRESTSSWPVVDVEVGGTPWPSTSSAAPVWPDATSVSRPAAAPWSRPGASLASLAVWPSAADESQSLSRRPVAWPLIDGPTTESSDGVAFGSEVGPTVGEWSHSPEKMPVAWHVDAFAEPELVEPTAEGGRQPASADRTPLIWPDTGLERVEFADGSLSAWPSDESLSGLEWDASQEFSWEKYISRGSDAHPATALAWPTEAAEPNGLEAEAKAKAAGERYVARLEAKLARLLAIPGPNTRMRASDFQGLSTVEVPAPAWSAACSTVVPEDNVEDEPLLNSYRSDDEAGADGDGDRVSVLIASPVTVNCT